MYHEPTRGTQIFSTIKKFGFYAVIAKGLFRSTLK